MSDFNFDPNRNALDNLWGIISDDLDKALSTAERVVILRGWLQTADDALKANPNDSVNVLFLAKINGVLNHYENTLQLEKSGSINVTNTPEQDAAYKRVTAIFEKQTFWSGSLSDFVYAMDSLALKGYLKANDLEKALAETFQHQPKGKDKPEKLTAEKIKSRRRNMKGGRYTESNEIRRTVETLLQNLPSK